MWSSVEASAGQPAPCARGKHSATLLGGHVYVLGGRGAGGALPLRDFWRYSLASGSWERLECRGEAPPSLQEHSATAHKGRLYVFGGEAALSTDTPLWIYDTETQLWRKLAGEAPPASSVRRRWGREARAPRTPRGRRGHSAHALDDCLLVYGGYKDLRGSTDELWAFHYETETWQAVRARGAAGPARHRHAAVMHRAALYVHGGQCDLRDCGDIWRYDTVSRAWGAVRAGGKLSPGARSGHAAVRAGSHMYIFGGEVNGHASDELWRFHFEAECWERVEAGGRGPSARVDARALLVCGGGGEGAAGGGALAGGERRARAARRARGSYTALADRDSTESLVRHEAALAKSRSAYAFERRGELARDPLSAPDLAAPPSPPPDKLVYLDSEEEAEARGARPASVRFARDEETSDYASAERVNGAALAFSNPHYLGPDVRRLGAALTPDSGAGDVELRDLGARAAAPRLLLLLAGGREAPHAARLRAPLSLWLYRLL